MNLFLLQYNNYYNRIIKKFDTIQEYGEYVIDQAKRDNFNPGDGVDTKIIVNYDGKTQPDYVILTDDRAVIISRWFVLDAHFIRKGQYEVTLHRDVIADNYDKVIDAPCFIEKAMLENDDPMIFNNEDMSFNQIKTTETLLKDETNSPWIVGYIPSDSFKEATDINSSFIDTGKADIEIAGIENWDLYDYTELKTDHYQFYMGNAKIKYAYIFNMIHKYTGFTIFGEDDRYALAQIILDQDGKVTKAQGSDNMPGSVNSWGENGNDLPMKISYQKGLANIGDFTLTLEDKKTTGFGLPSLFVDPDKGYLKKVQNKTQGQMESLNIHMQNEFGIYENDPLGDKCRSLNGKTILDTNTNTLYRIRIQSDNSYKRYFPGNTIDSAMNHVYPRNMAPIDINGDEQYVFISNGGLIEGLNFFQFEGTSYTISLIQQEINIKTTVLSTANRTHLVDAPYDMFCMPYNEGLELTDNGKVIKNSAFAALNMAIEVARSTGSGNVYDVQLLPYCPLRRIIQNGKIDITGVKKNAITSADGKKTFTYMLWCDLSTFDFDIPYSIKITDKKLSNECDLYRLCSPNYGSAFEFSAAKNNGVTKFNVDITYKPFNPYIHINPDFKGLYGNDFNDARGLIVGGDFSLTQLTSAWADYELTNKNYQNAFDRNIQSMEMKNKYQKTADIANAVTGTLMGAGTGAMAGGMTGHPAAAVAGGVLGAAGSGVAGYFDVKMNEELRKEEIANTKDQFGYQLANIQAIPYALAKTSAMTANNKLFPFIEYYTCTDAEKNALIDKIRYNGMTVMRVGRIRNYIKPYESYVKGRIIRLDNLGDDFHMAATIASELNQGIFI